MIRRRKKHFFVKYASDHEGLSMLLTAKYGPYFIRHLIIIQSLYIVIGRRNYLSVLGLIERSKFWTLKSAKKILIGYQNRRWNRLSECVRQNSPTAFIQPLNSLVEAFEKYRLIGGRHARRKRRTRRKRSPSASRLERFL